MSKQFVRLAADIVIANSTGKGFTTEQLTQMLKAVSDTLEELAVESGGMIAAEHAGRNQNPSRLESLHRQKYHYLHDLRL